MNRPLSRQDPNSVAATLSQMLDMTLTDIRRACSRQVRVSREHKCILRTIIRPGTQLATRLYPKSCRMFSPHYEKKLYANQVDQDFHSSRKEDTSVNRAAWGTSAIRSPVLLLGRRANCSDNSAKHPPPSDTDQFPRSTPNDQGRSGRDRESRSRLPLG